jgi:hypothetical protein
VRSPEPIRSGNASEAEQASKFEAQRDTVDDNIRRMIEAAYT